MKITKNEVLRLIDQKINEYRQQGKIKQLGSWGCSVIPSWKKELLLEQGAITNDAIVSDYPIMKLVKKDGTGHQKDFEGNLDLISQEVRKFNEEAKGDNWLSEIVYYPRTYYAFQWGFYRKNYGEQDNPNEWIWNN